MTIISTTVGRNLRRKRVAIRVNKKVWSAVLGCSLKNDRTISVHFQGKPFTITVTQVYVPTSNAEEAETERFYEDLQDLELAPQKRCPFHYRGLQCKSRKLRDTWSNRWIWPWSIKWSRAKANRVLPRENTGHSKHPVPTTQENVQTTAQLHSSHTLQSNAQSPASQTSTVCELKGVHQSCILSPASLTYMQSISCIMVNWMKHKLELRLPGEI